MDFLQRRTEPNTVSFRTPSGSAAAPATIFALTLPGSQRTHRPPGRSLLPRHTRAKRSRATESPTYAPAVQPLHSSWRLQPVAETINVEMIREAAAITCNRSSATQMQESPESTPGPSGHSVSLLRLASERRAFLLFLGVADTVLVPLHQIAGVHAEDFFALIVEQLFTRLVEVLGDLLSRRLLLVDD